MLNHQMKFSVGKYQVMQVAKAGPAAWAVMELCAGRTLIRGLAVAVGKASLVKKWRPRK